MENVAESERNAIEIEWEMDTEEEVFIPIPQQTARIIYRAPRDNRLYARPLGGLAAIVGLLFVPLVTVAGMLIPVVFAEIYLLDWTYSKLSAMHSTGSAEVLVGTDPEDKIDREVARTGPKDQFMK